MPNRSLKPRSVVFLDVQALHPAHGANAAQHTAKLGFPWEDTEERCVKYQGGKKKVI